MEAFDQAIVYEPDYPEFLGPYAVALYETKDFERAKEIGQNFFIVVLQVTLMRWNYI